MVKSATLFALVVLLFGCATHPFLDIPKHENQSPPSLSLIRYATMAERCRRIDTVAEIADNHCQRYAIGDNRLQGWNVAELAHTVDDFHDFSCVVYLQVQCEIW